MRCAVPPNWQQSYFITSQAALPNWQRMLKSQIAQDKLRLPVGSACQMSQQIKCIHIQVDCCIHAKVPEPIAARFGQPLIVECLFNRQA